MSFDDNITCSYNNSYNINHCVDDNPSTIQKIFITHEH